MGRDDKAKHQRDGNGVSNSKRKEDCSGLKQKVVEEEGEEMKPKCTRPNCHICKQVEMFPDTFVSFGAWCPKCNMLMRDRKVSSCEKCGGPTEMMHSSAYTPPPKGYVKKKSEDKVTDN